MKPVFCNKCHRRIIPPKSIKNIKIGGTLKLNCGYPNCKGFKKIKPEQNNNQDDVQNSI